MTQLGEGIDFKVFVDPNFEHSEDTCPWPHKDQAPASAPAMDPQEFDEDTHGPIPKNLGKKLGDNMGSKSLPAATGVWIHYRREAVMHFWQGKKQEPHEVQTYSKSSFKQQLYPLQYAPHHLIPGNESLKVSTLIPYMGDDDVIKNYKSGGSLLTKGASIDYDVNAEENGVWLPSPYALSNSNKWPSEDGVKAVRKRKGKFYADELENFKDAYAAAVIEESGGRQFHMRHNEYSEEVKMALDQIAKKLHALSKNCDKAPAGDGKLNAPAGLKGRLTALSSRLSTLLTGPVWRAPFFADNDANSKYLAGKKQDMLKGPHGIETVI